MKETEPRTPTTTNRPVRERKSVKRLIESDETDVSKEFHIEKGCGTPLKDIPNVAFKLSRRTVDDNLKLLHTILFNRRAKAAEIKSNISSFSGFVWHENEEKQMIKVKEKFDKCNKENLMEFCDLLDMPVTNANTRKEDIIAKLIDYLVAPKATKTVLVAEQEKSIKGKKRTAKKGSSRSETATPRSAKSRKKNEDSSVAKKRMSRNDTENESVKEDKVEEKNKNNVPDNSKDKKSIQEKKRKRIAKQDSSETGTARSRRSVKSRKKNEDSEVAEVRKRSTDTENEAEEGQKDEKNEAENGKGVPDKSKDEMPEKPENEDKNDSGKESEDVKKVSKTTRTSSRLKESAAKSKAKKTTVETKPRTERKRTSKKPLSTNSESDHNDSEGSPKVFSRKKKNVKKGKQKSSSLTKSSSKDKTEKVTEREDTGNEKSNPSEDQLRKGIRDLLKVVDFNTATFADTVKLLGKRFNVDLTPRKASIKTIIQEELTKLVAEEDI
jgi:protein DEK